jgi:hypothetical protein
MHKEVWKGWNTPRRLTVAGFLAPVIYILHCGICQDMPPVIIRFRNKDGGTRVVAKKISNRNVLLTITINPCN